MKTLSIVIPAYNEERYIGALLDKIRAVDLARFGLAREILVVDDGSSDGTAAIVEAQPDVVLVRMPRNGGKGRAVREGIARARGELILIQDADLEYEPDDYGPMLAALLDGGVEAVYGSRYLRRPGRGRLANALAGRHPGQSRAAYLGGQSLSWVAWACTGHYLSDTVTALKLFRAEVVKPLELETTGFETDHEITSRILAAGARIREVPIRYHPRSKQEGKKIGLRDWFVALHTYLRHGARAARLPSLEDLKNLAMRSQTVLDLHARFVFPRSIPAGERGDRAKQALIRQVKPYTLLHYPRLSALYDTAAELAREGVAGSFVECGVWNGGSAALLARAGAAPGRETWLFDSWEGVPEPGEHDVSFQGSRGRARMFAGSREKVEALLDAVGVERARVHLVQGWFEQTLPASREAVGPIALLHLDCDWYASVRVCLEQLYDAVVPGGAIFIDDYGYWKGCRRAVDEFFAARGLAVELWAVDDCAVYLRR